MSLAISTETTFLLDMVHPEYGPELYAFASAVSDPNGNEADLTTGWSDTALSGTGSNVFESQSSVKNAGSYALHSDANDTPTDGARFWVNVGALGLSDGDGVKIEFDLRHIGTGGQWSAVYSFNPAGNSGIYVSITSTDNTFTSYSFEFTYDSTRQYLIFTEDSVTNNGGVYFDNLSVKKAL